MTAAASPFGATGANPYPGLRPFRDDEEHLFFGRERQVDAMVAKLRATGFLAVLGASGSGKSSLVNCGLRPALYRGLMDTAGSAWRTAQFRPGNRAMRAMAAALCAPGALHAGLHSEDFSPAALIESTLRSSRLGLVDAFREANLPAGTHLLLVVDQFEELFRYRHVSPGQAAAGKPHDHGPSAEAVAFVNLLLAVREQPDCPIHIVITMRSDFLGDCAQFQGLPEALNAGQYLVPRMTRDERRMAITGPAGVEGASISPVLLTRLVNDVGDNPDQLSILQHALNRTWALWESEGRPDGEVQLRHYEAIGTMAAALDNHATRAFNELDAAQQVLARRLFKVITDSGTDARGIRRPTTFGQLCEITQAAPAALLAVMAVFRKPSRSFLMPALAEPVEPGSVIDISHESLMRVWKRLQEWGVEEAQSAQMLRRLADSAKAYPHQESLWQDPKLQLALDWEREQQPNAAWARLYGVELAPAQQFLRASEAARAEVAAEATARADRKARAARRRRVIAVGAAFAVVVGASGLLAWSSHQQAEQEAKKVKELEARAEGQKRRNQNRAVTAALFDMVEKGRFRNYEDDVKTAEVPKLEGMPREEALRVLKQLDLISDIREVEHAKPADTIIDQFPRNPSRLALGDSVYLVVAVPEGSKRAAKGKAEAMADPPAPAVAPAASAAVEPAPAPTPAPAPVTVPTPEVATAPPPAAEPAPAATDVAAVAVALPAAVGADAGRSCPDGPWTAWLGNAELQAEMSRQKGLGNYPKHIQGQLDGNDLRFRAVFAPRPKAGSGFAYSWDIYRSQADRDTLAKVRGSQGFAKACEQAFVDPGGAQRWQITWAKGARAP